MNITSGAISKYYFAGASRIAMRKYTIPVSMKVEYLVGDHLGSTSITTDANGAKVSEMRYKPWGETRYSWADPALDTSPAYAMTRYQYTGQFSYESEFGLYFYNARWYDSQLSRFAQADTIVPGAESSQAWDRYAYGLNCPNRMTDPTGHSSCSNLATFEEEEGASWLSGEQDTICNQLNDIANSYADTINSYYELLVAAGDLGSYHPISATTAFNKVFKGPLTFIRSTDKGGGQWKNNKVYIYNLKGKDIPEGYSYLVNHPGLVNHEVGHALLTHMGIIDAASLPIYYSNLNRPHTPASKSGVLITNQSSEKVMNIMVMQVDLKNGNMGSGLNPRMVFGKKKLLICTSDGITEH